MGAPTFLVRVRVDLNFDPCFVYWVVLMSALLCSEKAVSTTHQHQRNTMFPDRSFNMEVSRGMWMRR